MYKITIKRVDVEYQELLAMSYEELRMIVSLAKNDLNEYEIISVEKLNCNLASEFLEEIVEKEKPNDLVYGLSKEHGYKNKEEDSVNTNGNYPVDMY